VERSEAVGVSHNLLERRNIIDHLTRSSQPQMGCDLIEHIVRSGLKGVGGGDRSVHADDGYPRNRLHDQHPHHVIGSREFAVGYRVTWHFAMNLLPMPFAMIGLMQQIQHRAFAASAAPRQGACNDS
jgi:hypothetical protein